MEKIHRVGTKLVAGGVLVLYLAGIGFVCKESLLGESGMARPKTATNCGITPSLLNANWQKEPPSLSLPGSQLPNLSIRSYRSAL
jgi:hypothetical protein